MGQRNKYRGFTLIEMLVTVTLFVIAMAALVGALRAGIRAYEGVRAHHERQAHVRRAFKALSEDVRHLAVVSEEEAPLAESVESDGIESLTITALASREQHRAGVGFDWNRVTYSLAELAGEEGLGLRRTALPYVGPAAVGRGQEECEEFLLRGVRTLSFDYVAAEGLVPEWQDAERLPGAVVITMELDAGPTITKSIWIPVGALGT
ncbi:MAG: prepilin-type N-terminal cleavage/methylation domain-containing protein [Candidatus Hydrogenedentes bacterium]|nr:prepilin-type N-terminal cleavage/methylation domain-containing protein [Candidatus Hydrogenedentota bacterium]